MTSLFDRAREQAQHLIDQQLVDRIWRRDATVWAPAGGSAGDEIVRAIANRLGWLSAPTDMRASLPQLTAFRDAARSEATEQVFLLGMGGSSLCAEVMRAVSGIAPGYPDCEVLDTTDPRTIANAAARLSPPRTLFIVASKSGGTVEVAALERFFENVVQHALPSNPGSRFVAITDPGTSLADLAARKGYRAVFINPPDIGGRFSALSLFGLVPAALMGADEADLLDAGESMAEGCRQSNLTNPGLQLGALLSVAASAGRDKLTLLLPPSIAALGLWIEQLVAESTGKHGTGILPIVDEPIGHPGVYGEDRLFVAVSTDEDALDDGVLDALGAEHPVLRLTMRRSGLGAEFFRWEFAVAVAGADLGINPFDEPNVQEAKERTRQILEEYQQGRMKETEPAALSEGVAAFTPASSQAASPAAILRGFLASAAAGDYVALLSYLSPDAATHAALQEVRGAVRDRTRLATTLGIGPRYLHSTGQYHKGGPNRGICVIFTAEESGDVEVPGMPYSFGRLKRAQAIGDFEALAAHGRRVVRIHLTEPDADAPAILRDLFRDVLAAGSLQ